MPEMENKPGKECGCCYAVFVDGGECAIAKQVRYEARLVKPNKEKWEIYLKRVNDEVLPQCVFPDQLTEALKDVCD